MNKNERLAQIKERLEKATPGPWRPGNYSSTVVTDSHVLNQLGTDRFSSNDVEYYGGHLIGESISEDNREFIAHSWADIKFLLDQIQIRECPRCKNTDISPNDNFCTICGLKLAKEHKNNGNHL